MAEEIKEKKCACKGGNLDRFIQPIILLILAEEADTGYGAVSYTHLTLPTIA